jgi:hypothetical protein
MENTKEIRQCDINTKGANSFGQTLLGITAKEQDKLEEEQRQKGRQYGEVVLNWK